MNIYSDTTLLRLMTPPTGLFCRIDFTIGWTWDQPCDDTAGYIGCFVQEERAGILGDFDSSADAMNNEVSR